MLLYFNTPPSLGPGICPETFNESSSLTKDSATEVEMLTGEDIVWLKD